MKNLNSDRVWDRVGGGIFVILVIVVVGFVMFNFPRVLDQQSSDEMAYSKRSVAQDGFAMAETSSYLVSPADGGFAPNVEERQIVKTGNLSLVVSDIKEKTEEIEKIVSEAGGLVQESSVQEPVDGVRSGWVSVRVPALNFDEIMTVIKETATRIESENVSSSDVTRQVVDNEARLKNLRAQEAKYLEILAAAKNIDDILSATQYLNNTRWEIENIETQLKNVKEQVSYSTIYVNLVDEGDVEIFGIYWKPLVSAKQALQAALQNVTKSVDLLVEFIFNIPVILFWTFLASLVSWIAWKIGRNLWLRVRK